MVRNYIVYGVDAEGQKQEIIRTPRAREARIARQNHTGDWAEIKVFNSEGEISVAELNLLSDKGHRYA